MILLLVTGLLVLVAFAGFVTLWLLSEWQPISERAALDRGEADALADVTRAEGGEAP